MNYDFTPPPERPSVERYLDKVGAIMLFRQAAGETLTNSKHFVEKNLGEALQYEVKAVGDLIYEYYRATSGRSS